MNLSKFQTLDLRALYYDIFRIRGFNVFFILSNYLRWHGWYLKTRNGCIISGKCAITSVWTTQFHSRNSLDWIGCVLSRSLIARKGVACRCVSTRMSLCVSKTTAVRILHRSVVLVMQFVCHRLRWHSILENSTDLKTY